MNSTYVITHQSSQRFYIGSTSDMYNRQHRHISDLRLNRHACHALQALYNVCQELSWNITQHNTIEEARLDERNRIIANKDNPNILNTKLVRGPSLDSIQLMSQNSVGVLHTFETKQKMSEARKGVPKSKEHIDKIMTGVRKSVIIDGVIYDSQTAAAEVHGVSVQVVRSRIASNTDKFTNWQNL